MYLTILKLLSPYLQRFAAKKTAAYLQARRERRLQQAAQDANDAAEIADQVSWASRGSEGLEAKIEAAHQVASRNVVWFTLSGVVLGSAFGYAMAHLLNRSK